MSKFKVGDRVRIREESSFYGRGKNNPTNEVGQSRRLANIIITTLKSFGIINARTYTESQI